MAITVRRLTIQRQSEDGAPNYLISDGYTGEGIAQVEWLNVEGVSFTFGGSEGDVVAQFDCMAHVMLANERDDADCPDRVAAGATISFVHSGG